METVTTEWPSWCRDDFVEVLYMISGWQPNFNIISKPLQFVLHHVLQRVHHRPEPI